MCERGGRAWGVFRVACSVVRRRSEHAYVRTEWGGRVPCSVFRIPWCVVRRRSEHAYVRTGWGA